MVASVIAYMRPSQKMVRAGATHHTHLQYVVRSHVKRLAGVIFPKDPMGAVHHTASTGTDCLILFPGIFVFGAEVSDHHST